MAITRAQQYRQMLEDGGMLVQPGFGGTRQGYRSAKAQEVQGRTKASTTKPGTSGGSTAKDDDVAPGYNPKTGRFERPDPSGPPGTMILEKARTPKEVKQDLRRAINKGAFRKKGIIDAIFPTATKFVDSINRSKLVRMNNAIQRQNYINSLDLNDPKEKAEYDRIMNELGGLGIDIIAGPETLTDTRLKQPMSLGAPTTTFKPTMSFDDDVSSLGDPDVKDILGQGFQDYLKRFDPPDRDDRGPSDPCLGPNPPAYCFTGIRSVEPEEKEDPSSVFARFGITPRIAGSQFAAEGGRIGFFKGAQADASAGKGAMSPGTDTGGGFRGGEDKGPKGPPSVISKPPKKQTLDLQAKQARQLAKKNFLTKFLAHDRFTDQLKARQAKNYHQLGALDFMARYPDLNPEIAKGLATGYQNVFELGRAIFDGPGGKTIKDALDTAKTEAELNAIGIDAFSNPASPLFQEYANMVPESGAVPLARGGIASLDREAFLLGGIAKGLKKATRAVKKIAKSPIGKAALLYGLGAIGGSFGSTGKFFSKGMFNPGNIARGLFGISAKGQALRGFPELAAQKGLFGKLGLTSGYGGLMPTFKGGITLASILPLLVGKTEEEKKDILDEYYASQQLNPSLGIRGTGSELEFDFYGARTQPVADGGRIGYQEGSKEPVAKKTMPLLDMDGQEMDLRDNGGFVPIGRMEKADDVPARLSKNEFVFTADAVRNAGDGDVDKGAEVMYNMMKNLERGGNVSDESQGLEGARRMFQTSKRLEEVL